MKKQEVFGLISVIVFIFFAQHGFGQTNRDSLAYRSAARLRSSLHLSNAVFQKVVGAEREKVFQIDSLGRKNLTPEQRQPVLTAIVRQFRAQLKSILTTDQWAQLARQEKITRDSFLLKMQAIKMPVKELPQQ